MKAKNNKIATPKKLCTAMQQFQKMIYGSINSTKIGSDLFDVAHI